MLPGPGLLPTRPFRRILNRFLPNVQTLVRLFPRGQSRGPEGEGFWSSKQRSHRLWAMGL